MLKQIASVSDARCVWYTKKYLKVISTWYFFSVVLWEKENADGCFRCPLQQFLPEERLGRKVEGGREAGGFHAAGKSNT